MTTGTKHDSSAKDAIGAKAYQGIPKSVFALVAYHFADRVSDGGAEGSPLEMFLQEVRTLGENGIIPAAQPIFSRASSVTRLEAISLIIGLFHRKPYFIVST